MISRVLSEDIKQIIDDNKLPWDNMQNASILVTGATGLIGSIIVLVLRAISEARGLNLFIVGISRNKEKLSRLMEKYGANLVIAQDIREVFSKEVSSRCFDYIFHCAAVTRSAEMVARPVDVITTAVDGTRNTLDIARSSNCRAFVYLSSMEIYGQSELSEVRETDLGSLDLLSSRSSYPESKRLCENLCASYASQYGVSVRIARLAQTFGAGTPKDDTRVFAQFARSALNGDDIVLHTKGKSQGNYCYIMDTVAALLHILLKGKKREAYNIANPNASATILEMAQIVANVCGKKSDIVVEIPKGTLESGYAPDIGYKLNADKLCALGWQPQYGLADMYRRMIADWQEI